MNAAEAILSKDAAAAPAVVYGNLTVSRGDLLAAVMACQEQLASSDAVFGDRVGLFSENSPFFVAAYLGIIRSGCCVVPFQTDCGEAAFERIARSTGMRLILVSRRFCSLVQPLAARLDIAVSVESDEKPAESSYVVNAVDVDAGRDLAAIMFTSGSTGEPKGVAVTHRNITVNTQDILSYAGISADDRAMVVLPFSYCFGLSLLHTHLMAGGSVVLNNRFMFAEKVLDEMVDKRCTGLAGVPATYQILLRKTRFAARSFPALRWLQQAGGRLPSPMIDEIHRAFPAVRFYVMYGQTEATARLSYLPPERLDDKLGSIGRGLPHTRLEVLREDGEPVEPGTDEIGEITAVGENIASGYWRDPDETARFFRNGRLYTGDMARVDADGFIFIVERGRDFIKAMGHRVSPAEIEDVLAEIPEIVEAAVVGVPDDLCGEAVHAFVSVAPGARMTVDDVKSRCAARLPNYKVPRDVEFIKYMPKNASGKVDKAALRGKIN
jgi:long-chain acyl-CoA synthetase